MLRMRRRLKRGVRGRDGCLRMGGRRPRQYRVDTVRIAPDGGDGGRRAVLPAPGWRRLPLRDRGQGDADPRQLYAPRCLLLLLLLLVMMVVVGLLLLLLLLLVLMLLVLLVLLMVAPLRHRVQRRERLAGQHAAPGGAQVQELEDVRGGRRVEVVQPRRPGRRRRVARGRWRRARAQRGACRRTSVAFQVAVPPVSVAQRRHVLARLRLWAGSQVRARLATGVVAAFTTAVVVVVVGIVVVVVVVGQRTHHLAPRIVRQ